MTLTLAADAEADRLLDEILATRQGQSNPYPLYRRLRDLAPLHRSGLDGNWYATGFEACRFVLGDPRFGKGPLPIASRHGIDEARVQSAFRRRRPSMITVDDPDHTRLRGAARGAFLPPKIEDLRHRVAALVDARLDLLAERGEGDIIRDLAFPLPVAVIGELIGIPPADRDQFRPMVADLLGADRPDPPPDAVTRAEEASDTIQAYFADLIRQRQGRSSDDLLSSLVAATDAGTLGMDELFGTLNLLLLAGFVTTTNLVGNGLLALCTHPGEMARLWSDTSLVAPAVEEMLRFDTPVQIVHRVATKELEFEGRQLREGDTVFALLGAANRDPARFPNPDRIDVGREDNPHLAFAWGVHFCLGARLARLEGQLVFAGLRERFASVSLVDEPVRRPGLALRQLDSLRVRVVPR